MRHRQVMSWRGLQVDEMRLHQQELDNALLPWFDRSSSDTRGSFEASLRRAVEQHGGAAEATGDYVVLQAPWWLLSPLSCAASEGGDRWCASAKQELLAILGAKLRSCVHYLLPLSLHSCQDDGRYNLLLRCSLNYMFKSHCPSILGLCAGGKTSLLLC